MLHVLCKEDRLKFQTKSEADAGGISAKNIENLHRNHGGYGEKKLIFTIYEVRRGSRTDNRKWIGYVDVPR